MAQDNTSLLIGHAPRYLAPQGAKFMEPLFEDELFMHPGHDLLLGVTIAAGELVIFKGDMLYLNTLTGKYQLYVAGNTGGNIPCCIATRMIAPSNYYWKNPTVNYILDRDYETDALWSGIVKTSVLRNFDSVARTALKAQVIDSLGATVIR